MTTQDHDTDPSTPGAKRLPDPRPALGGSPEDGGHSAAGMASLESDDGSPTDPDVARSRPTTDPGIAPPPEPRPIPRKPMGIVVPPVVRRENDSVDILLDGISREQPEPSKTTPQTDGQSAAAYHAEHAVPAAQPPPEDEPKVVIYRPPLAQTIRVAQSKAASDADPKAWTETTAVGAQPLAGRVIVAVLAGSVVVMVIFVALQRISSEHLAESPRAAVGVGAATSAAPATVAVESVAPAPAPAPKESAGVAASTPAAALAESPQSAASSAAANNLARKAAPVWRPPKARPKPSVSTTKPASADLGEFKTSF
jgi:hypothetical protein